MRPSQLPRFISSRDFQNGPYRPGNQGKPNRKPSRSNRPNHPAPTSQNRSSRGNKPIKIRFFRIYDVSSRRTKTVHGAKFNVKLSSYKNGFTLGLDVTGSNISKVVFGYAGKWRTEKKVPYIINGDDAGRLQRLRCRKGQTIHIKCTVYANNGKKVEKTFQMKCV